MSAEKIEVMADSERENTEAVSVEVSEPVVSDPVDGEQSPPKDEEPDDIIGKDKDENVSKVEEPEQATSDDKTGHESASGSAVEAKQSQKQDAEEQKAVPEPADNGPKLLDLAFAMDCTGSMGSYINQAQQNIRKIVEDIVSKEAADVHLALVEYRDHPPQDPSFVTRVHDFTSSVRDMKGWLDQCSAEGGGDGPEAVADALHQVLKLNWRQTATKICIFISDAPPHGLGMDSGDGFPNGCPDGLDPMEIAGQLAEKSITLYLVGCEPSINRYRTFFTALAHVTGGKYVPLGKAQLLTAVITGGAQEELSLERLMAEVNEEVQQELDGAGEGEYSHRDLSRRIHSKMASKGYKTKNLHYNSDKMPQISSTAESLSYCINMEAVRKKMPASEMASDDWDSLARPRSSRRKSKKSKSAAAASYAEAKAPGSRSSLSDWGSKLSSTVYGWFGSDKGEDAKGTKAEMTPPSMPPMTSTSAPKSGPEDIYEVVEDELGEEQVHRMVQKSLMQQKLRSKTRHEED